MTHLRKIMLEELQRRHYSEGTTRYYIRHVERFARHFNCSPDRLGPHHIRQYQAHLFSKRKLSPGSVTNHLCALRFFYIQTLKFAEESHSLLKQLSRGRGYIVYSRPTAGDQIGADFDAPGHIDTALLERIGVPQGSDFYLCGPSSFLKNMRAGLKSWGVPAENVHTEIFGVLESITPGMAQVEHTPHLPQGAPGPGPAVSFARSGITAAWDPKFASLLELA